MVVIPSGFGGRADRVRRLKMQMRELRLRRSTPAGKWVLGLGPDAALDPLRLAQAVQKSKGIYRLTPEMKLVVRLEVVDQRPGVFGGRAKSLARRGTFLEQLSGAYG